MSSQMLHSYTDQIVCVITNDGRNMVGLLRGTDHRTNLILEDCQERVYTDDGVEVHSLGLYIVRGDNVSVVGEIERELDEEIDWKSVKGKPLPPLVH